MIVKNRVHQTTRALVVALLSSILPLTISPQAESKQSAPKTQIVLLGTGTPCTGSPFVFKTLPVR